MSVPQSDAFGVGMGAYLEPKYMASDVICIGIRLEAAMLSSNNLSVSPGAVQINASKIIFPVLLTGDYYFSNGKNSSLRRFGLWYV